MSLGLGLRLRLGLRLGLGLLFWSGGWVGGVGGWLEIWRVKLTSTQVVLEVEVGVELGNHYLQTDHYLKTDYCLQTDFIQTDKL